MVTSNTNANVEAARTIAAELGQPTRGKGVDRLAAALVEAVNADITEQEAVERLLQEPNVGYAYASVMFTQQKKHPLPKPQSYHVCIHVGDPVKSHTAMSNDSLCDALEKLLHSYRKIAHAEARRATIAARIEREMAEADAAEAALKATAPLEFRPDGSPADVLPVERSEELAESVAAKFKAATGKDMYAPSCDRPEDKVVYTGKPGGDFEAIGEPVEPFDGVAPADGGGVA